MSASFGWHPQSVVANLPTPFQSANALEAKSHASTAPRHDEAVPPFGDTGDRSRDEAARCDLGCLVWLSCRLPGVSLRAEAIENATAWLASLEGEAWLVMCSSYQLCEPWRVTLTDASALARMARVFGEQLSDF